MFVVYVGTSIVQGKLGRRLTEQTDFMQFFALLVSGHINSMTSNKKDLFLGDLLLGIYYRTLLN